MIRLHLYGTVRALSLISSLKYEHLYADGLVTKNEKYMSC